ncbi:DNA alkylation repair enzyme [Streptomyces sp. YIM 130001]|uniref:DNA alkylation repair protein n=1 Tax=Streptomyces sp. YIM 130001 TaxID=2259644 RepID=UPI000E647AA5|nr:DNA alkylation repair protein [Streptomyces sp. YIM 130001]RII17774.1 DNA alkylation repair enzyme [Streptomyces sp. YIM 130001]
MCAATFPVPAQEIRDRLAQDAVPGRAAQEKQYLRSELEHIGVPLPALRTVARDVVRACPEPSREQIAGLARALWSRPVHEHRSIALLLLAGWVDRLREEDTALLDALLRECGTWAHVDLLAPSVSGRMLLDRPRVADAARRWAADPAQWVRRGGILTFLPALRQEQQFPRWFPVFGEVVDPLLGDDRFFVRKAIGWMLREGTKHHPGPVAEWLGDRLDRISALTLREGARRLPEADAARLLSAHAELHPNRPRRRS